MFLTSLRSALPIAVAVVSVLVASTNRAEAVVNYEFNGTCTANCTPGGSFGTIGAITANISLNIAPPLPRSWLPADLLSFTLDLGGPTINVLTALSGESASPPPSPASFFATQSQPTGAGSYTRFDPSPPATFPYLSQVYFSKHTYLGIEFGVAGGPSASILGIDGGWKPTAVPSPSTLPLFIFGLAGLAFALRMSKNATPASKGLPLNP